MATALLDALSAAQACCAVAALRPLDYFQWLRPQRAWLSLNPRIKLFRAGNQAIGKSTAGLAEVIWRCQGRHPYHLTRPPPIQVVYCCTTAKQSLALQRKLREILPVDQIEWTQTRFTKKNGFGANTPMVIWRNGSTILFVTSEAGPSSVQGGSVDYVHIDELCTFEMYVELEKRIMMTGGQLGLTLTPVNNPAKWLEELVEDGVIVEVHAPLTRENIVFDDGTLRVLPDGTICDQAWIDLQWKTTAASVADVRLNGAWESKPQGAYFGPIWDTVAHINDRAEFDEADGVASWHLGIDYASADRPMGLVATLIRVQVSKDEAGDQREFIIVEDMVALPGTATMDMFAADILAMLLRNGLKWRNLKTVYGDNPVKTRFEFKSNLDLTRKITRRMKIPQSALMPKILGAKEGRASSGTKDTGCRYLYEAIASNRFLVRSRCKAMTEAIETWDYGNTHPAKDRIDTLRYGLKDYVFSGSNPHLSKRRLMVGAQAVGRVGA